ncbi:molybdate ABC transporter substrate-binding protein [Bacillota bacterium LX-D]|nr:molybdate ABC transporter substrate-binding protein [Bacillota bacterium LX-D]
MKRILLPMLVFVTLIILVVCQTKLSVSDLSPSASAFVSDSSPQMEKVTLRVLAAASLTESLKEIADNYKRENPSIDFELNFAGTQALVSQIEQGVDADVFLSANMKYMTEMKDKGYVEDYSMFVANELVIVYYYKAKLSGLEDLVKTGVTLAIADESVPVGQYTLQMLHKIESSGNFPKGYKDNFMGNVRSKEMDVKSVEQKVQLGEVDAGIVYKSDAAAADQRKVKTINIPKKYNVIAEYPVAVLRGSAHKDASKAFVDYLLSNAGMAVMEKYGFQAALK